MSTPILESYFHHLRAGNFEEAVTSFTDDAFYSHNAYDPGSDGPTGSRLEARGHSAILRMWNLRGERDWQQQMEVTVVGDKFFLEGDVTARTTGERFMTFLSSGRFAADGRIEYYVEYDSRPPVGSARVVP